MLSRRWRDDSRTGALRADTPPSTATEKEERPASLLAGRLTILLRWRLPCCVGAYTVTVSATSLNSLIWSKFM
ncbi:MAG: hypothetical protein AW12_02376 [Candidatus Accumulibacter sp. BA-94]|nr:MAG: hypothetical protein AW12_02376 [Candidatus Accumulibacter sp. BA-94]